MDSPHLVSPLTARWIFLLASLALLVRLTACNSIVQSQTLDQLDAPLDTATVIDSPVELDAPPSTLVPLDPTQGRYRGICDGSAAIALDFTHFIGFSDNDQHARVYQRGANQGSEQDIDVSALLGMSSGDDADLEDAVRIDDRIYVLGSHGRKNDGSLDTKRYRFAAFEVHGTSPITLSAVGRTTRLLQDMLDPANWSAPDTAVISALENASRLDQPQVANLAPKVSGTNIEGLARAPTMATPERLLIGLRNPQLDGRTIVVTLMNPSAVTGGAAARFGEAIALDLGGLGIRSMTWSDTLAAVLLIAGPRDGSDGPFRLYRWSGVTGSAPMMVLDIVAPVTHAHAEAVVAYPNTKDVEILFDSDDVAIGGTTCDSAPRSDREFRDLIVHLD